jgi:hypothetical protein
MQRIYSLLHNRLRAIPLRAIFGSIERAHYCGLMRLKMRQFSEYAGDDRSFRSYFYQPRETLRPYFSTVIESVDGVQRLYISHPINSERVENTTNNDNNGSSSIFNGVVVSSIDLDKFGQVLESQLSDRYSSALGMFDRSGVILYSSNASLIGKDVFGDEFQIILPAEMRHLLFFSARFTYR